MYERYAAVVEQVRPIAYGVAAALLITSVVVLGLGTSLPQPDKDQPVPTAAPPAKSNKTAKYRPFGKPAEPVRLIIPSQKVKAAVLPLSVSPHGALDPPADPLEVGWWKDGAEPGAKRGQIVVTGHTVHDGGGALDNVGKLQKNQQIIFETKRGRMLYRVQRTKDFTKDEVTQNAQRLFGQGPAVAEGRHKSTEGRLVLVSCTDWNGEYYESNVFVFAKPLGRPPKKDKSAQVAEPSDQTEFAAGTR